MSTKQEYEENLVINLVNNLNENLIDLDLINLQISLDRFKEQSLTMSQQDSYTTFSNTILCFANRLNS